MTVIVISMIVLGVIGLIAATLLFGASKKFHVFENPKIAEIEAALPGANCGGCGYSGCHAFAVACADAASLENLHCTSLTPEGQKKIAEITGLAVSDSVPLKAVLACKASCDLNLPANVYDGVRSCAIENNIYQGESECVFSCLGGGDCVRACPFGTMTILPGETLPRVDLEKCTGCGKCVEACPRSVISLHHIPEDHELYWVACSNKDKGPIAMKECKVSCIGCGKCLRACTHEAINVTSFLARIDTDKCVGCGDCASVCPRDSIIALSQLNSVLDIECKTQIPE